jgi:hypothetical protein
MDSFIPHQMTEDEIAETFPEMARFGDVIDKLGGTLKTTAWQIGPRTYSIHQKMTGSPELVERVKTKLIEGIGALPFPVELEIIDERGLGTDE